MRGCWLMGSCGKLNVQASVLAGFQGSYVCKEVRLILGESLVC